MHRMSKNNLDEFGRDKGHAVGLKEQLLAFLKRKRKPVEIEFLSEHFDRSVASIREAIAELDMSGYNISDKVSHVELTSDVPVNIDPHKIDVSKFKGETFTFGVTGDNHLCSKYSRLDVLEALFDIWEDRGVKYVFQCGNMIDGEARFNKHDLLVPPGLMNQVDYFIENWPQRDGIKTLFVTGDDHEGWYQQREGIEIGRVMEDRARQAGRDDLEYLGYMERNIIFGDKEEPQVIRVMHAGGGTAYAISYTSQKLAESLQGGEKPHIMLIGHYHKYDVSYPRGVYTVQVGCTQDQSPFMRKKKLEAHIGGVTLEVTMGEDGLFHNFTHSWHPFFDRDFYKKSWKYAPLGAEQFEDDEPKRLA